MNQTKLESIKPSRSTRVSFKTISATGDEEVSHIVRFSGDDYSIKRQGAARVEQKPLSTEPSDSSEDPRMIQHFEFQKSRRPSSKTARRRLRTELCLHELEKLLCEDIPKWLPGKMKSLRDYGAAIQFRGLVERCKLDSFSQSSSSRPSSQQSLSSTAADELSRVEDWLGVVILQDASVASNFPSRILSEIHFSIGLIRNIHADYEGAQRSFLNSLWILSSSISSSSKLSARCVVEQVSVIPKEQIASVMLCLGMTYGSLGDHQQMRAVKIAAHEFLMF